MENYIKIKYYTTLMKWLLTIMFLSGNLLLLVGKIDDDIIFILVWEISVNCLAVLSFILLSVFPRLYYIFDDKGCSFQNKYGKVYLDIAWDDVVEIGYGYFGFIPDGLTISWKERGEIKKNVFYNFFQTSGIGL